MTLRTFDPGLAYDKATGTGIGSTLAIVTNAVDGTPVDTYDMDGNLAPVITNRDGYFGQFQADADRIRIKIANLTMEATNLEAIVETSQAAQTSAQAALDAQAAAEAAAAGATAPTDTTVAAKVNDPASQTRAAMASVMGGDVAGLVSLVNTRTRLVAPAGTAAANVATLQAAVDDAAAAGVPLVVRGQFSVSGQVNVPSGSDIQFAPLSKVTQTASLTPVFVLNNVSNVTLRGARVQGKTSDYVNNSSVYGAAAVRVIGTSSDVRVIDCVFLGMAGLGVYIGATASDVIVRGCRMTGAGPTYITATTFNYSGGIVTETGATRWAAIENDISGFSQGIVTGDNMADIRVIGNHIHDIPGQHGLYLETMTGGVITGNVIHDCGLLGMKLQVGAAGVNDCTDVVITGNSFRNCGAQGILVDNPGASAVRFRRVVISDNTVNNVQGPGIEARYCAGLHISDNIVSNVIGGAGIRVWNSSQFSVADNRVNTCPQNGIDLQNVSDYEVRGNRVINPGQGDGASTEFGIYLFGASTAEGVIEGNRITDTLGHMRYGIYVAGGDQTTHTFRNNYVAGATDYGFRSGSAAACREWVNNDVSGALGRTLNAPTSGAGRVPPQSFGSAAPTTGAHVVGEIVWNTAPAASGTIGWVCTTAGTPGTWKTFGNISA